MIGTKPVYFSAPNGIFPAMPKRHVPAALVLAVIVSVAAWFWSQRPEPSAEAAATAPVPAADTAAPARQPAPSIEPTVASAIPLPAMPAADAPAGTVIDELKTLADAGNAQAACRLGSVLLQCGRQQHLSDRWLAALPREESKLEAEGKLKEADSLAKIQIAALQLKRECAGIPDALLAEGARYLRQAALAGSNEARLRYINGDGLGLTPFDELMTPRFDAWRREAPMMLRAALEAGSPESVLLLLDAHLGSENYLSMLLPTDPVQAQTMLLLARRLFGDDPALSGFVEPLGLDPEQTAAAQVQAAAWHERSFGGRRLALAEHTAAIAPWYDPDSYSVWSRPGRAKTPACVEPAP